MGAERNEPTLGAADAYRPPAANLEFADRTASDAVAIRQAHIGHERQLKSIGLLFGFGAALMVFALLAVVLDGSDGGGADRLAGMVGGFFVIGLFAVVAGVLAYGYRSLSPWVKYVGTPVSVLGLIGIPVGTLIHGWILYLIWCEKGRLVLSDDYAAIIRATPDVRYKRTVGDWIALALLVLLVVGLGAMLLFA
jgi:hypothetical protein